MHGGEIRRENDSRGPAMLPPSGLARMNECPMTKGVLWKLPGLELPCKKASLVAQLVKNLCTMREIWAQSLGWEDPLENGKATHSSILAWRIPWTV